MSQGATSHDAVVTRGSHESLSRAKLAHRMTVAQPGLHLGGGWMSGRRAARTTVVACLCGFALGCGARTGLLVGGAPNTVDSGGRDSGGPRNTEDASPLPAQRTMLLFGGL